MKNLINLLSQIIKVEIYFLNRGYIMGNSISKKLEEKYNNNDFQVVDSK